jgi:hypothetical protein
MIEAFAEDAHLLRAPHRHASQQSSFRRKPESSFDSPPLASWTPACAGVTSGRGKPELSFNVQRYRLTVFALCSMSLA